jgi:phenylalanyl-tRNA synthetase beta chain
MRLPLNWLRDHVAFDLSAAALADRLAMTGTEVERVLRHGVGDPAAFVVGRVLEAAGHPDADRLSVCRVDVGEDEPAQIVCGAPNVAAGQAVAVARPGAVMPDGTRLGAAKLRGVVSQGMILAEDELAIGTDHDGIMVLDDGAAPGTPLLEVLPIQTEVLELEITPNRPDCLGVLGVAREVHAITGVELMAPPRRDPQPGELGDFAVEVRDPDLCPRFTAVLFDAVTIGPSPGWLKARLMAAGQRPINNVVDITNFVMLLSGQPLHAFDADLVAGGRLVVRRAADAETIVTLDDVERRLDAEMVVIEDDDGPTSIAGVMGGARSEVRETTSRVLMEAATWDGPNIQRTSHRLALRTEASGRFEKQLQPEDALEAQAMAAHLMVELCGARMAPGLIDIGGAGPEARIIRLRDERVCGLLGTDVSRAESADVLTRLGFGVTDAADGLAVRVPHWRRSDVTREADLIEEIARLAAMERLPATLPARRGATGRLTPRQRAVRRLADAMAGAGLCEAVGWSFAAPDLTERLRIPHAPVVRLVNPMSEDQSVLRTTLLGSLLDIVALNRARGADDVRVWELGAVYHERGASGQPVANPYRAAEPGAEWAGGARDDLLPDERMRVGALLAGRVRPASWQEPEPPRADLFALKGVLAAVLDALRVPWSVESGAEPFLHPGRSAHVRVGDVPAGWLGELHPQVARAWDLEAVAAFELDLAPLLDAMPQVAHYEDLTSFPAVRQDLALVVDESVTAGDLLETVRAAGGDLLRSAEIFDVYGGPQVGEGRTSLALRLEFRAPDRTLTDEEAGGVVERMVTAAAERLGAERRA